MSTEEVKNTVFLIIKIALIVYSLMHLLIGLILLRQLNRIREVVRTRAKGCIILFSVFDVIMLFIVFILVIFMPIGS